MRRFHHDQCEWQLDQYDWECTCGLTRPEAPWFRELVERAAALRNPTPSTPISGAK